MSIYESVNNVLFWFYVINKSASVVSLYEVPESNLSKKFQGKDIQNKPVHESFKLPRYLFELP